MTTATAREQEQDYVPYTMNLPDGHTVLVRIPADMVEYDVGGEMMFTPEGMRYLDHVQVMAMRTPPTPSPAYIRTVRQALRLTQAQFAKRVGRSTITVKKWEAGDVRPSQEAVKKLRQVVDRAARRGVVVN